MLYKLYTSNMNYNDYNILIDGTNFSISNGIYDVIFKDSIYFGYEKNNRANISGFLNHIIPNLSEYREDLHLNFLKSNKNDEKMVKIIESNIYNVYLKTFDISNDSKRKIQLRINKENLSYFTKINDKLLNKYDLDFTNYIRSLLLDYAIKPLYQREYFSIYTTSKLILQAQKENRFVKFRTKNETITLVPTAIEICAETDQFYIFGFTTNEKTIVSGVKYSEIQSATILDQTIELCDGDCEEIMDFADSYFDYIRSERK